LNQPLLDGINRPKHGVFETWLITERKSALKLRSLAAKRLAQHSNLPPSEALDWNNIWLESDPYNPVASEQLIRQLRSMGKENQATQLKSELNDRFQKAGITWPKEEALKPDEKPPIQTSRQLLKRQKIQFCETKDKVRIAYATVGQGTPLV
jgi:hypothetical protein